MHVSEISRQDYRSDLNLQELSPFLQMDYIVEMSVTQDESTTRNIQDASHGRFLLISLSKDNENLSTKSQRWYFRALSLKNIIPS